MKIENMTDKELELEKNIRIGLWQTAYILAETRGELVKEANQEQVKRLLKRLKKNGRK